MNRFDPPINAPSLQTRADLHAELARQIEDFLSRGGQIKTCAPSDTAIPELPKAQHMQRVEQYRVNGIKRNLYNIDTSPQNAARRAGRIARATANSKRTKRVNRETP